MNQAFTTYPPHKPLRIMITRIARKECIEMIRDGRLRWAAGIVFASLTGLLLVGWKHYADVEAQRAKAQAADREIWVSQGEKSQHSAAHFGSYAFKAMAKTVPRFRAAVLILIVS